MIFYASQFMHEQFNIRLAFILNLDFYVDIFVCENTEILT